MVLAGRLQTIPWKPKAAKPSAGRSFVAHATVMAGLLLWELVDPKRKSAAGADALGR